MKRYILVLTLTSLFIAACSSPKTYAEREQFHSDSRHNRNYAATEGMVCEATRRALLRDGYIVEKIAENNLTGAKEFQIEDGRQAQLNLYATCAQRAGGATLFVTATEEHFDVKTSRQSTSLGVPIIAPISISKESQVDHRVKTRGETITDRDFYERFYRAVQQELGR